MLSDAVFAGMSNFKAKTIEKGNNFLFLKDYDLRHSDSHFLFILGLGFLLFRFLDILKPLGINKLQNLPRGWGVMTDDFAAALISACLLGIIQTFSLSFL